MFMATLRYLTQVFFCMVFGRAGVSGWGLGILAFRVFLLDRSELTQVSTLFQISTVTLVVSPWGLKIKADLNRFKNQ
jgi:hypothetical protein